MGREKDKDRGKPTSSSTLTLPKTKEGEYNDQLMLLVALCGLALQTLPYTEVLKKIDIKNIHGCDWFVRVSGEELEPCIDI